jgi:hypothetical protein
LYEGVADIPICSLRSVPTPEVAKMMMSPEREPSVLKITHSGSLNLGTVHLGVILISNLVESIVEMVFNLSVEVSLL